MRCQMRRCRTALVWCHTAGMPTTRPRYTFTDTGHLQDLLDAAQGRWPEVSDRKALLLKLAEEGHATIRTSQERLGASERRVRAQTALARIRSLTDLELLLSNRAWS
jgi:hypothetical protein